MRSQASKSTVGTQLSLFGLKLTPNCGSDLEVLLEINEIASPPKQFMQQGKDRKR